MIGVVANLVCINVALIVVNLCVLVRNRRTRAQIERQLRALKFAATEPSRRYEGPT
jgi:hypothetical protein